METEVRILIVGENESFSNKIKELVKHPQVIVDSSANVTEDNVYNFYIIESISKFIDKIHESGLIYLYGPACSEKVLAKQVIKRHIVDCLENDNNLRTFVKKINSFCKQKRKMKEASTKLDSLKAGDLASLSCQLKRTKSEQFVDFIQNHPLPMVLVNCECEVLHANETMEKMIGTKLDGFPASSYWENPDLLEDLVFDLKKEGQLLGREVTLKNIYGELLKMKIYTSLHHDEDGNWLNTRCLFVPEDLN